MMPKDIDQQIQEIRECFFDGKVDKALPLVTDLMGKLTNIEKQHISQWKEIFSVVLQALEQKDYLLAADIITYEIKDVYGKG